MKEEFLHYLWKYRLFRQPLITTEGVHIEVVKAGVHNPDSGPDFFDARLKIGDTLWAGNVEIHLQSSSWYEHGHHEDNAYNNVILHVVLNHDKPVMRANSLPVPCLECNDLIPVQLYEKYRELMGSKLWVPCAGSIRHCPEIVVRSCIEHQLIDRLLLRAGQIRTVFENTGNNWEEVFYRMLARSFGLKINTLPFEMLAASLPHNIIIRHQYQPFQIEALLFGQAGLLEPGFRDDYPRRLKEEYMFLQNKYSLQPLDASLWKFMRLRPPAFPTIRLAQFAAVMQTTSALFSLVLESDKLDDIRLVFSKKAGKYWDNHYLFDKPAPVSKEKFLGDQSIDLIIINTVIPLLFFYGDFYKKEEYKMKALSLLEQLPPENNTIIEKWKSLGIRAEDAFTTQGLLQLKQNSCDKKKCLHCRIGSELLK